MGSGVVAFGLMSKLKISVGKRERRASVGDVDDAADAALDRRGAQDRVGLRAREAELLHVRDGVQAGLAVGDVHVEVVLLALSRPRRCPRRSGTRYSGARAGWA